MSKKTIALAVALLIVLFLVGCPMPGVDPNLGPTIATSPVSRVLQALPEIKVTLPKSLRVADSGGAGRSVSRVMGDTTELTGSAVGSLKSQAWMDLQNGGQLQALLNKAFKKIGDFARAHELEQDTVFSIPITALDMQELFNLPPEVSSGLVIADKFLVKGTDPKDLAIYAKVDVSQTYDGQTMTISIPAKLLVKTRSDGSTTVELFLDIAIPQSGSQSLYAYLDSQTGECTAAMAMRDAGGALQGSGIQKSTVGGGGAISTVSKSVYGSGGSYNVAYGDDTAGGIASVSSWTDTYFEPPVTHDYYWGEYYNSTGDLIRRDNGDTNLWVPDWGLAKQVNILTLGLSTAPSFIYVRQNPGYEYSTDGVNWSALPVYGWNGADWISGFYLKQGSTWAAGDAIYYWKSWDSATGVNTYYAGYTVPAGQPFGGKSYYMSYEYPLKNLLPLTPAYAASYALIQLEGETSSDQWTDNEGVAHAWSWTNYDYYLNKTGSSVSSYEADAGDIWLSDKLSQYDVFTYAAGTLSKQRGYFFRASSTEIPPYFSPPDVSCVSAVQAQLASVLNDALGLSVDAYSDKFGVTESDPVFGTF